MNDMFVSSAYFGVVLSLVAYGAGALIRKKFKKGFLNPLLIATALTISVLVFSGISYETYYASANLLSWLLTPATVCLAVPLYEKIQILKDNRKAVTAGIVSGVIASMFSILVMSWIFRLNHEEYVTFLPKSVTTAIGIGISEELGGYQTITAAAIIITGVLGNVAAPFICRIAGITEPIAVGIAIGSSSHAIGTARAMEMGETEGAMSSLSIAVSGLLTVVASTVFSLFYT